MFFKKKSNVIFRNYGTFGYITDNRNFGYKKTTDNQNCIGDKILSESGTVFFSVLDVKAQAIDELANRIHKQFNEVDAQIIITDAKDFYYALELDGFIVSGKTVQECEEKDTRFSYKLLDSTSEKDFSSNALHPEKSTQDFLEEHFEGKPQLTNVHIEITSRCNERCKHCYIPHENKTSDIDADMFYSILKQCIDMRVLHLTISGGEPMLHKNFCDFLKKCKEYNFSVNILSNLTLLDDKVIKAMKANPLLGVQTSLYAMNSNVHDEITQMKGSFEKTKNAILKLIDNDIPLQISCPVMRQNKNYYAEVIEWANQYNAHAGEDYVIIGSYNSTTKNLNCRLSIDEVKDIIYEKIVKDGKYLEKIEVEAEEKKNILPSDFVCSVCNSSICITENGDVYPCAGWQSYIVGNVKENSLDEIWANSEKVQFLRALRKSDFPKCIQCGHKDFCTMCMVRNANESPTGDPLAVNEYFCEIANFIRAQVIEKREVHDN